MENNEDIDFLQDISEEEDTDESYYSQDSNSSSNEIQQKETNNKGKIEQQQQNGNEYEYESKGEEYLMNKFAILHDQVIKQCAIRIIFSNLRSYVRNYKKHILNVLKENLEDESLFLITINSNQQQIHKQIQQNEQTEQKTNNINTKTQIHNEEQVKKPENNIQLPQIQTPSLQPYPQNQLEPLVQIPPPPPPPAIQGINIPNSLPKAPFIPGITGPAPPPFIPGINKPPEKAPELNQKQENKKNSPPPDSITKKLQVNPIPQYKLKDTFWQQILDKKQKFPDLKIDYQTLLNKFTQKKDELLKNKTKQEEEKQKEEQKKAEQIYITSQKRVHNISIIIKSFPKNYTQIYDYLIALNQEKINLDFLEKIRSIFPQKEEISKYQNYNKDIQVLIPAEQFLVNLLKIPRIQERIDTFYFKLTFHNDFEDNYAKLEQLIKPFELLISDPQLQEFLMIILQISNYLNHGTSKSNSLGITLDSLQNLETLKSFDKKLTILEYISSIIHKHYPEIIDFFDKFMSFKDSQKLEIQDLEQKSKEFNNGIQALANEILLQQQLYQEQKQYLNEQYLKIFQPFYKYSEKKITLYDDLLQKVQESIQKVGTFYGESDNYNSRDFLLHLFSFIGKFQKQYNKYLQKLKEKDVKIQNSNNIKWNQKKYQEEESKQEEEFKPRISISAQKTLQEMKQGLQNLKLQIKKQQQNHFKNPHY